MAGEGATRRIGTCAFAHSGLTKLREAGLSGPRSAV